MTFSPDVYERIREGCQRSAEAVVPAVYDLVQPKTVADIGGGEGHWGRAFFDRGCSVMVADDSIDVWRFEAEAGPERRRIDFLPVDLRLKGWTIRVNAERAEIARIHGGASRFDLAVCLEVAEHLPAESADYLVAGLCAVAPVVLFSAAIPGQGGVAHINERWPDYWASLFRDMGYACADLRSRFWDDETVEPWYRQNLLLFADLDQITRDPERFYNLIAAKWESAPIRGLVHPALFAARVSERDAAWAKLRENGIEP
jgi:hypothetical protein